MFFLCAIKFPEPRLYHAIRPVRSKSFILFVNRQTVGISIIQHEIDYSVVFTATTYVSQRVYDTCNIRINGSTPCRVE